MQQKKNIQLIILLAALLATVTLIEFTGRAGDNLGVDKKVFQLDPNKEINKVILDGPNGKNQFDFHDGRWHLNDTLLLDQSMRDVFFTVVSQLEIRRPVLQAKADSLAGLLQKSGVRTTISFGEEQIQQYWISGNSEAQVSWIMGEDRLPYQVHIPGYQSYVAGIFTVPSTDWRSRFLLDVNFALIRSINLDYPDPKEDLTLNYQNSFFTIPGVQADSLKVANFLEALSFLQATRFIAPDDYPIQANLSENTRVAQLSLNLVNGQTTPIAFFFDPQEEQFLLAQLADGSWAKTEKRRLLNLFKSPADFE